MPYFRVYLPNLTASVEVSLEGTITDSSLKNAVGLRFSRFTKWVKTKGGEVYPVKDKPVLVRSNLW